MDRLSMRNGNIVALFLQVTRFVTKVTRVVTPLGLARRVIRHDNKPDMAKKRRLATARVLKGTKASAKAFSTPANATPAVELYIGPREVARRLDLKPRTVGQWARERKLPVYWMGRYLRFKWSEIERHLAATCRCEPVAAVAGPLPTTPQGPDERPQGIGDGRSQMGMDFKQNNKGKA
jgi:excisionase family DNA binding protein